MLKGFEHQLELLLFQTLQRKLRKRDLKVRMIILLRKRPCNWREAKEFKWNNYCVVSSFISCCGVCCTLALPSLKVLYFSKKNDSNNNTIDGNCFTEDNTIFRHKITWMIYLIKFFDFIRGILTAVPTSVLPVKNMPLYIL